MRSSRDSGVEALAELRGRHPAQPAQQRAADAVIGVMGTAQPQHAVTRRRARRPGRQSRTRPASRARAARARTVAGRRVAACGASSANSRARRSAQSRWRATKRSMAGMPTPGGTTTSTRPPGNTRIDSRRARRLMRTCQPGEASAGDHNGICSGSAAAPPLRLFASPTAPSGPSSRAAAPHAARAAGRRRGRVPANRRVP